MNNEENDFSIEAIFLYKILSISKDNKIKWKKDFSIDSSKYNSEHVMGDKFTTELMRRKLVLYCVETFQNCKKNTSCMFESGWVKQMRLGFVCLDDNSVYWEFNSDDYPVIKDMYNFVARSVSNLDEFMNDVIDMD